MVSPSPTLSFPRGHLCAPDCSRALMVHPIMHPSGIAGALPVCICGHDYACSCACILLSCFYLSAPHHCTSILPSSYTLLRTPLCTSYASYLCTYLASYSAPIISTYSASYCALSVHLVNQCSPPSAGAPYRHLASRWCSGLSLIYIIISIHATSIHSTR